MLDRFLAMWHLDLRIFGILKFTFGMIILINMNSGMSYTCEHAEYDINGQCCPMCAPGTHVHKHCTDSTSTSCKPCFGKTFLDEPNGLVKCRPCTVCDPGLGLIPEKECNLNSDTVCGVLAQHFCTEPDKKGCRLAQRHTTCKPGQFVKRNGTKFTDTLCEDCPNHSFSDGLSTTCKPHTDCQSLGLSELKAGSPSSDSECEEKSLNSLGLTLGTVVGIVFILIVVTIAIFLRKKMPLDRRGWGEQEMGTQSKERGAMIQQPQDKGEPNMDSKTGTNLPLTKTS